MIRKILTVLGLASPIFISTQVLAHPDFIPHVHPHAHSFDTGLLFLSGVLASFFIGGALVGYLKRKRVKK